MDDPHVPNLECRDPVHGFVKLSRAEWSIVDCPTFQRLRDIRQLAMAHLVYPGATHTRFEHSLGTVHLSTLIFDAIKQRVDKDECPDFAEAFRASDKEVERHKQILRLASLLHDVGHSPFSHSGENLMPNGVQHEDMTARLIRETEIAETLEKGFSDQEISAEEVIGVATSPRRAKLPPEARLDRYRFLNDILAGELGSDRMDYLLRDAVHSGQCVGQFDYRKLIESMMIVSPAEETGDPFRLGLDDAGWLIGEQMVAARYLTYVALYFHKTKRIYEIHLEEFLAKWLESEYGQQHLPTDDPRKYVNLTDSQVWAAIYEHARGDDGLLTELSKPFVNRSHHRLARELLLADNDRSAHESTRPDNGRSPTRSKLLREDGTRSRRLWDAERFDKLANDVRIKFGSRVHIDHTRHSAVKFFGPKDKIWVSLNGKTRYLDDLSEIVSGMPDRIWRGRIYAEPSIKSDVKSYCDKWLESRPTGTRCSS